MWITSAASDRHAASVYCGRRRPTVSVPGELPDITYTSALLAILAGVIHAGLTPVIQVAGVYPNLALVAVVLVTVVFGFTHGTIWAFAAGLTANLVVSAPLGSLPLTLLLVTALVAAGDRVLGRLTWVYPVVAAFAASVVRGRRHPGDRAGSSANRSPVAMHWRSSSPRRC